VSWPPPPRRDCLSKTFARRRREAGSCHPWRLIPRPKPEKRSS